MHAYLNDFVSESRKISPLVQVAIDLKGVMQRGKDYIEELLRRYGSKQIEIKKLKIKALNADSFFEDLVEIDAGDFQVLHEPEPPEGFEDKCRLSSKTSPFLVLNPEFRDNLLLVEDWRKEDELFTATVEMTKEKKKIK